MDMGTREECTDSSADNTILHRRMVVSVRLYATHVRMGIQSPDTASAAFHWMFRDINNSRAFLTSYAATNCALYEQPSKTPADFSNSSLTCIAEGLGRTDS